MRSAAEPARDVGERGGRNNSKQLEEQVWDVERGDECMHRQLALVERLQAGARCAHLESANFPSAGIQGLR